MELTKMDRRIAGFRMTKLITVNANESVNYHHITPKSWHTLFVFIKALFNGIIYYR